MFQLRSRWSCFSDREDVTWTGSQQMDAEAEEEPSPEPEPEGEQTESDLTNSENEVLIVVSFQVFFFYVFEGSMPTDGWQRHPHANADERVIFWRSGAKRFLDFFLASRYPCELGITSGSMEDNEFLATMKAILTSCLGWQRVDETRVEEVQALEDGHGRRILMFGRDCIEDRSRGSRKKRGVNSWKDAPAYREVCSHRGTDEPLPGQWTKHFAGDSLHWRRVQRMALGSTEFPWSEWSWTFAEFFWCIPVPGCTRSVVWCAKFNSEISFGDCLDKECAWCWELWLLQNSPNFKTQTGWWAYFPLNVDMCDPFFPRKSLMFACLRCWAIGMRCKSILILSDMENHHTPLPKMLSVFEHVKSSQVWWIRFFCSP